MEDSGNTKGLYTLSFFTSLRETETLFQLLSTHGTFEAAQVQDRRVKKGTHINQLE